MESILDLYNRNQGVKFLLNTVLSNMFEHYFQCPYCWEKVSMLIDPSINQKYVEDCEVCCNPIEVTVKFEEGELTAFSAESIEQ